MPLASFNQIFVQFFCNFFFSLTFCHFLLPTHLPLPYLPHTQIYFVRFRSVSVCAGLADLSALDWLSLALKCFHQLFFINIWRCPPPACCALLQRLRLAYRHSLLPLLTSVFLLCFVYFFPPSLSTLFTWLFVFLFSLGIVFVCLSLS